MIKTIVVQIGNSDDKLSQSQWSSFVENIDIALGEYELETHFFGGSENWKPWQNVAWVIVINEENIEPLRKNLNIIRKAYLQESVAITIGDTEFI